MHDVLLTSDHVLSRITPHQFPQAITPFAGLEHYFHSLSKMRKVEGVNFALGGHEDPIWDLRARIDAIALFHRDRLARVKDICAAPRTVLQVAQDMFGEQEGYSRILAIDEAGAHVEYLHQLGQLRIANLDDVARARDPVIEYVVSGVSARSGPSARAERSALLFFVEGVELFVRQALAPWAARSRANMRLSVRRSMPSTSAARVLLPPVRDRTRSMYRRSRTPRVGQSSASDPRPPARWPRAASRRPSRRAEGRCP